MTPQQLAEACAATLWAPDICSQWLGMHLEEVRRSGRVKLWRHLESRSQQTSPTIIAQQPPPPTLFSLPP